ncbi:transposase domain-containing protein [Phanerochaete sordida]|uniref:Transposase domain-containing protein n=1 Tax=Phanerochaete sordida TaxID=48140 RepID=A0A9P3G2N7_9APHY|nr:transposase domain-containing protein [Phanerochaete sordida]
MGNRHIPCAVKRAAVRLFERRCLPLPDILKCVDFSESTFWRAWRRYRATGDVINKPAVNRGRPRKLHHDDVHYLTSLVRHHPDWFLDELLDLLEENRFISVHFLTICRELQRAGLTTKQLQQIAKERDKNVRANFVRTVAKYTPVQLGFLDKTHKDERTKRRRRGRARRGHRARRRGVFVRGKRFTLEGCLTVDGIVASTVVAGSMTRDKFLEFLEYNVMPLTSPFPGPFSVLIMDNARIHHGEAIAELAERFGVHLVYLPPYSPNFNPIEEAFSKIKAWIRRNPDVFSDTEGLVYDLMQVVDVITPEDAEGYIAHAGYL